MSYMYFEIQADDLLHARDFYKGVFGWEFERNLHAPVEYYAIETGGPGPICSNDRPKYRLPNAAPMPMSVQ